MSALHHEVGRKGDGVEGRDLGVARRGDVNDPETRSLVDDAVGPIVAAFVEHEKFRLCLDEAGCPRDKKAT